MKLFPKIIGIGIAGLVIATLIASIAVFRAAQLQAVQNEMEQLLTFRAELAAAQDAHLQWLRTINTAIIDVKPELKITVDGRQCAFGKWYYADGAETVKNFPLNVQESYGKIAKNHLDVHAAGGELVDMWDKDNLQPCIEILRSKIVPTAEALLKELSDLRGLITDEIQVVHQRGTYLVRTQNLIIWGSLAIGALALLSYSWIMALRIVSPLKIGGNILAAVAEQGNIEIDVPESISRRRDEIGVFGRNIGLILKEYRSVIDTLKHLADGNWVREVTLKSEKDLLNDNFEHMISKVNIALSDVSSVVAQVATGAQEVLLASDSLSQGATTSAASLEEITASMGEVGSQTKTNAQNATEANLLAKAATTAAVEGKEMMQRMISSMEQITNNAADVQRVIKVIDDISFQTNLLALNAAVEAARAGVHGKGFAVVAEEVRNLAARCAKAAGETSQMIENNNKQIHEGAAIATETSGKLDTIVDQAEKTAGLINDIAIASNEQAQGIQQISLGLQQIDSVTQQNTAGAEETASVSREMSSSASTLQTLVGQFKLRKSKNGSTLHPTIPRTEATSPNNPVAVAKVGGLVGSPSMSPPKPVSQPATLPIAKPAIKPVGTIPKPRVTQNPNQFPDEPAHDVKGGWGGVPNGQEISINLDDKNFGKY